MKTYLVPMFLIVRAKNEDDADMVAAGIQQLVYPTGSLLYQDEVIPTMAVPEQDEYHSIRDYWGAR